ncbi:hypothetical protein H4683_003568 [Filibacter limicola]|uniref:Uncharacterized protein n=1 Tax=Sporosarcina limicola TaxID=34101 RepID=A0A927R5U1_9BACL|nr:hypothetical protein [Sporosarcina limicola]
MVRGSVASPGGIGRLIQGSVASAAEAAAL